MEWKKILVNRRLSAFLLLLLFMELFIFWQDCEKNDRKRIEQYGQTYDAYLREQELQHIDAYRAKIQAIMEQADAMDEISIFSQENSFSKRNVALTREAFASLQEIELTYVKGRTVTAFFAFRLGGAVCMPVRAGNRPGIKRDREKKSPEHYVSCRVRKTAAGVRKAGGTFDLGVCRYIFISGRHFAGGNAAVS